MGNAQAVARQTRVLGDNPAVVADRALLDAGLLDAILAGLGTDEVVPVAPGEPTVSSVGDVAKTLPATADVVVAVGGGSTLDSAKLAAALLRSDRPLTEHLRGRARFAGSVPVVAVPTTAGSGAEVTRTAVVSASERKTWAWDEALRPAVVVLDPGLTLGLPEAITVASGLDAFVHGLEAATARNRNATAEEAARWACGEILEVLPAVTRSPGDVSLRRRMLVAACAAGAGIDRCGTGLGHAIGHALGSLAPVSHGLAVMLGTLVTIDSSVAGNPDRYQTVAQSFGMAAEDVPELVRRLAEETGFEKWMAPATVSTRLTADVMAEELRADDHRPMLRNGAQPVNDDGVDRLAERIAEAWNRIGR